jgi:hypothetical protein
VNVPVHVHVQRPPGLETAPRVGDRASSTSTGTFTFTGVCDSVSAP